jgi:putative component of membrane protein insertase Oxa1/YidC/SpoIIIJ protein YidD
MELEYHLDMAMVLMLNVCNVQNKLWEFLSHMTHKQCVHVFSCSFYLQVKS